MKFIRLLLRFLIVLLALAAIVVVLAFVPAVQTWFIQMQLARQPGLQVSVGSFSARFGKADISDLHLEYDGAILTLPTAQVALPLKSAAWDRKILIQSMVAKGWTLDLTHVPFLTDALTRSNSTSASQSTTASSSPSAIGPVRMITHLVGGILGGWNPPCDLALNGVDLEGDVLVPAPHPGREPVKVHVTVKGGGLSAGQEGTFAIDAEGVGLDADNQPVDVAAHSRVVVAMSSPKVFKHIAVKSDLSVKGGSLSAAPTLAAEVVADRVTHEESCSFALESGTRSLASVQAHYSASNRRIEGAWKIDLRDSDLAPFAPDRPLPSVAAAGAGSFDTDAAVTRVHVDGQVTAHGSHFAPIAPSLDRVRAVILEANFDFVHSAQSLQFEKLGVSLSGLEPVVSAQSVQPFTIDEKNGDLAVSDPQRDWMEIIVQGFPLEWIPSLPAGLNLADGMARGEFAAQPTDGGFTLRPKAPLTAAGISLRLADKTIARKLDLSCSLLAKYTHAGWELEIAPMALSHADQRLGAIEGRISRLAGADQPVSIAGKWSADFAALAAQPEFQSRRWLIGRSASGDFSGTLGTPAKITGTLAATGHDSTHNIAATVSTEVSATGDVTFHVPLKLAVGPSVSDLAVDGTWIGQEKGGWLELNFAGENVILDDLRLFAAPLLATSPVAPDGFRSPTATRDQVPFWGNLTGPVSFSFDRLRLGDRDVKNIRATLDVTHGAIRVANGFFSNDHGDLAKVEGGLSFDAAADAPYHLKFTAALGNVDAKSLLPPKPHGPEPVIEGRFAVGASLTGTGGNLADLVGHLQEEYQLTSKGGVLRLLKTIVSGSVPEPSTPVADTLGTAGSLVGSFFGFKKNSLVSGEIHLPKNTEAVLDFTYRAAEIVYDELTITATRGSDRTVHLIDIAMTAPDERLTGSGRIDFVEGQPLRAEPLHLDLQLGARNGIAGFLTTAGLLSARKDPLGYTLLNEPIHFTGTLDHVDGAQWHDLLAEAAKAKPEPTAKNPTAKPAAKN